MQSIHKSGVLPADAKFWPAYSNVHAIFKALGVVCVTTVGEPEAFMAHYAKQVTCTLDIQSNQADDMQVGAYAVLAKDSDFFIHDVPRYMLLPTLKFEDHLPVVRPISHLSTIDPVLKATHTDAAAGPDLPARRGAAAARLPALSTPAAAGGHAGRQ